MRTNNRQETHKKAQTKLVDDAMRKTPQYFAENILFRHAFKHPNGRCFSNSGRTLFHNLRRE